MSSRCRILWANAHLTAPSAVHLTTCFSPDSQLHRLSVKASLPLSPLQRFSLLTFHSLYYHSTHLSIALCKKSYAHRAVCISPYYTLKGYGLILSDIADNELAAFFTAHECHSFTHNICCTVACVEVGRNCIFDSVCFLWHIKAEAEHHCG